MEGGTGYTQKFLGQEWSVYKRDPSLHPIPELQDRVLYLSNTTQALMDIQQIMARGMDETSKELSWTKDELARLNRKMISTIYPDGERIIKVFKKTQAWSNSPLKFRFRISRSIWPSLNLNPSQLLIS